METQAGKVVKPSGFCQGRGGDRGALKPTEANEQLSGGGLRSGSARVPVAVPGGAGLS